MPKSLLNTSISTIYPRLIVPFNWTFCIKNYKKHRKIT